MLARGKVIIARRMILLWRRKISRPIHARSCTKNEKQIATDNMGLSRCSAVKEETKGSSSLLRSAQWANVSMMARGK